MSNHANISPSDGTDTIFTISHSYRHFSKFYLQITECKLSSKLESILYLTTIFDSKTSDFYSMSFFLGHTTHSLQDSKFPEFRD